LNHGPHHKDKIPQHVHPSYSSSSTIKIGGIEMDHKLCHFEIPAEDPEKVADFYKKIFNWKIEKSPGMESDYWFVEAEGVGGGIFKKTREEMVPINYVDVECIEEHSKTIEEAGGKIVMPKTPVPGMGWFTVALDPENNPFGIWEKDEEAK